MTQLIVRAIKDCKGDKDEVLMHQHERGVVQGFVTFKEREVHAVVVKENLTIVSIDINKLVAID